MKKKEIKKIALLTAAGIGSRMGQDIPKQFINVYDKPIIVYTLECFQNSPDIDAIIVICLDGWHEVLRSYAKQFGISKLVSVISGGSSGFESIKKGILEVKRTFNDSDIVLIHDGIRPNVSNEIIHDSINVCMKKGNAITAIPCVEAMLYSDDKVSSSKSINRDMILRTQTPHTFFLNDIYNLHREAEKKGIVDTVASCTLMIELGKKVYFSRGSEKNFKLTTCDDIEMFKALLNAKKDVWMK